MKRLSVITVSFNNLRGLKRTAQSVLAQDLDECEWLVIDGGSTDGTVEYLKSIDESVDCWVSEADSGIYNAMNKGIRKAAGEYLIFMNAGDAFASSDVLSKVLANPFDADVLYGDFYMVKQGGRRKYSRAPDHVDFPFLCVQNLCHQSMFFRSELLKAEGYDESLPVLADWMRNLTLSMTGRTFRKLPVAVCEFDVGGTSSRMTKDDWRKALRKVFPPHVCQLIAELDRWYGKDLREMLSLPQRKDMSLREKWHYRICKHHFKWLERHAEASRKTGV